MKLLMCRECGEFVPALNEGEIWIPMPDECSDCGGTEFKDNDSGRTMTTEDDPPG